MALGLSVSLGSASVDLACLASTLWWASQRVEPPSGAGSSPARLADVAERAAAVAAAGAEANGGAPEVQAGKVYRTTLLLQARAPPYSLRNSLCARR
jgi:hypothetical protein